MTKSCSFASLLIAQDQLSERVALSSHWKSSLAYPSPVVHIHFSHALSAKDDTIWFYLLCCR